MKHLYLCNDESHAASAQESHIIYLQYIHLYTIVMLHMLHSQFLYYFL